LDGSEFSAKLAGAFERYQKAVSEAQVARLLEGLAAFSRQGPLSPFVVIWLMIFQRLHPKGTLAVAVRELATGPIQAFVQRPESEVGGEQPRQLSTNTSAYSQARSKLPLEVAEKVSELIFQDLEQQPQALPELGLPVFLLDGSTILLAHSPELVETYPPARNQHGSSHWPVMRVVVAHDVVNALAAPPCYGPQAVSEQALAKQIMSRLPAGCGVLGDSNFGVFSMAYHAAQHNHPSLFRLTEARARKLHGGFAPASKTDRTIRWVPSREDRRSNPEIPAEASVEGRLLAFKVRDSRGQWQKLYFFTTLTVAADQILKAYGYRWNIETDLRSLKREVRLRMIEAKSPDMVAKELVLGVAAYNLTRAAMNQAAQALNMNPRQFSFSLAQDTLNAFLPAFARASSDQERRQIMQRMLQVFAQSKLPRRSKRRSAPRAIWPRPCSFPKRKVAKPRKASKKGAA
jgi:putative transposase